MHSICVRFNGTIQLRTLLNMKSTKVSSCIDGFWAQIQSYLIKHSEWRKCQQNEYYLSVLCYVAFDGSKAKMTISYEGLDKNQWQYDSGHPKKHKSWHRVDCCAEETDCNDITISNHWAICSTRWKIKQNIMFTVGIRVNLRIGTFNLCESWLKSKSYRLQTAWHWMICYHAHLKSNWSSWHSHSIWKMRKSRDFIVILWIKFNKTFECYEVIIKCWRFLQAWMNVFLRPIRMSTRCFKINDYIHCHS